MINIGCKNKFWIEKFEPHGAYLINDALDRILLPKAYLVDGLEEGEAIEVFVYNDSEDRPVAVTTEPLIQLNQIELLTIKSVAQVGAFADWGLPKDLLIPFSEQQHRLSSGDKCLVYMFLDEKTDRLVGTTKLGKVLNNEGHGFTEGDEVDLLVWHHTDLGTNMIINGKHVGLAYKNEIFQELNPGDKLTGYIKTLRPDNKIDLSLQKTGLYHLEENASKIWQYLKANEGFVALHDKSAPEDIQNVFKMSKKTFKNAIGILYKKKLVTIDVEGIRLTKMGQA